MNTTIDFAKTAVQRVVKFLIQYKLQALAFIALTVWCLPYFTTGDRIEWGDYSFFAQAYEAMRISILDYHQFPWFNPWLAGGVPLYANPQMGVFSLQLPLVLLFGAPLGLKLAVYIYTLAGFASMQLLLRKYFKISVGIAVLLSLVWIFSSFFVSHLPSHFTFAWYMLAPLYVYFALTVKDWRGGLLFGLAFAIMALAQIHNPFFHISFVCAVILLVRLCMESKNRKAIIKALLVAAGVFVLLAGHRALLTVQNVKDFPRAVVDPAATVEVSTLGPILPFSTAHPIGFINYPLPPFAPYGFGEVTATIGIFGLIAVLTGIFTIGYTAYTSKNRLGSLQKFRLPLIILGVGIVFLAIGYGPISSLAPYSVIKHIPIFGEMRVPSRWFLWFDLALIVFIGLMIRYTQRRSFPRLALITLLCASVVELFVLNAGYQSKVLSHDVITAPKNIKSYSFEQTAHFGETLKLPDGGTLPRDDGHLPLFYREYEATTFNLGVLMANDALVDLNTKPTPRCPWEKECRLVLSKNAEVASWSPQKIVLKRTAPGKITLNMNASNYFIINDKRMSDIRVAEPYKNFVINDENSKTITIAIRPSAPLAVNKLLHR